MMPILLGSMFHSFGVSAHQADGLQGVIDGVGLRVVAVAAEAVAQDDGVDAVVVEEWHEIRALAADVEGVVSAAGDQDDGGAGIDAAIDRVDFDRRVVNIDDAVDAAGHGLAHVVLFRLAHAVHFEEAGTGRIEREDDAAGEDGRGRVGSEGGGSGLRETERRGQRRKGGRRRVLDLGDGSHAHEQRTGKFHSPNIITRVMFLC